MSPFEGPPGPTPEEIPPKSKKLITEKAIPGAAEICLPKTSEEIIRAAEESASEQAKERTRQERIKLVGDFMEAHEADIKKAERLFHSADYQDIKNKLGPALLVLLEDFQKLTLQKGQHFTSLPSEVFERIIGRDYVSGIEAQMMRTGDQYGFSWPHDEIGGGDWIRKTKTGADILDVQGHGQGMIWAKALIVKMIEARESAVGLDPREMLADLDEFVGSAVPNVNLTEFARAKIEPAGTGHRLTVEAAGGIRVIVRDRQGRIKVINQASGYPPLGLGAVQAQEIRPASFDLAAGEAALLSTDGLFEMMTGHIKRDENDRPRREMFQEALPNFASGHRKLSHGEFRRALADYVKEKFRQQTTDNELVHDDVSFIMLEGG